MNPESNVIEQIIKRGLFLYTNSIPRMWLVHVLSILNHMITLILPFMLIAMMSHLWFVTSSVTYIQLAVGYVIVGFIWWIVVVARDQVFYNIVFKYSSLVSNELFATTIQLPNSYTENLPVESQYSRYMPLDNFGYLWMNDIIKPLLDVPLVLLTFSILCFILGFFYFTVVVFVLCIMIFLVKMKENINRNEINDVSETEYNGSLNDVFNNINAIKSHCRTDYFINKNALLIENKLLGSYTNETKTQILDHLAEACLLLIYICTLTFAVYYTLSGIITMQYLVVTLLISWFSITPIKSTLSAINAFHKASILLKQYAQLLQLNQAKHRQKKIELDEDYSGEIVVQNVNFMYPNSGRFKLINLNLTIKQDEVLLITGASGSGKSTLLKLLAGLAPPSSGFISIDHDIRLIEESSLRNKIIMLSNKSIFENSTVYENLIMSPGTIQEDDINNLLNNLNIPTVDSRSLLETTLNNLKINNSSKYQELINEIILAKLPSYLINKIIILDEPFNTHDIKIYNHIKTLINALKKNNTIIIASRYAFYSSFAQHIIILKNGTIEKILKRTVDEENKDGK